MHVQSEAHQDFFEETEKLTLRCMKAQRAKRSQDTPEEHLSTRQTNREREPTLDPDACLMETWHVTRDSTADRSPRVGKAVAVCSDGSTSFPSHSSSRAAPMSTMLNKLEHVYWDPLRATETGAPSTMYCQHSQHPWATHVGTCGPVAGYLSAQVPCTQIGTWWDA